MRAVLTELATAEARRLHAAGPAEVLRGDGSALEQLVHPGDLGRQLAGVARPDVGLEHERDPRCAGGDNVGGPLDDGHHLVPVALDVGKHRVGLVWPPGLADDLDCRRDRLGHAAALVPAGWTDAESHDHATILPPSPKLCCITSHPRLDPTHNFSAVQIKWLRLGDDAQERRNAGPRRSTSRLQPDRVLLRDTNRSFSRLVGALLAETGAGSELRANAPAVAVPTATRAPVGGRRSAVASSPLVGPQRGSAAVG